MQGDPGEAPGPALFDHDRHEPTGCGASLEIENLGPRCAWIERMGRPAGDDDSARVLLGEPAATRSFADSRGQEASEAFRIAATRKPHIPEHPQAILDDDRRVFGAGFADGDIVIVFDHRVYIQLVFETLIEKDSLFNAIYRVITKFKRKEYFQNVNFFLN